MKICVFGSGGVGGYFGARLAQAGLNVTFVARAKHRSAMASSGLKVSSISGDFHLPNVQVIENPLENAPYDIAFVAVKAWQVTEAAMALKGTLNKNATVIPLQNGVGASEQLIEVLGKEVVITALCGLISYIKEPGHVCHVGLEPFIKIGECGGSSSERVDNLLSLLNNAEGMNVTAPEDIRVSLWLKFLFIVAMSGIGSISRAPIGVTRENNEIRRLLEECVREAYDVGCAHGLALPSDSVELTMRMIDRAPADATASMQRDIIDGKPSELYDQNEAVKRLGVEAGIDTPVNSFICAALSPLENRARGLLVF